MKIIFGLYRFSRPLFDKNPLTHFLLNDILFVGNIW